MNKAYVFNLFFNGLGVARALGKNGIEIVGLDSINTPVGRYSKYVKEFYKVNDPNICEKGFIDDLISIGKKEKEKPLLIPTNDVWAIAVSKYKDKLEEYFITYSPDFKVIESLVDKEKFFVMMNDNNIKVPYTYCVRCFDDLYKLKEILTYPLIIKPNQRMNTNREREETKIYNTHRLVTVNQFEEFYEYKDLINRYSFLIQQKITGLSNRMYTVGIYADKDSIALGVFCGRKIRGYPAEYGDCFAGESLWIDELVEISKQIIKSIGYTGIAEIEFKKNETDEQYYLIEINPRTWSWVGITPYCGVNLPLIAYKNMVNRAADYTEMKKDERVLWIRKIDDLYNCKYKYRDINDKDFPNTVREWKESLNNYDELVSIDDDKEDKKPYYAYKIKMCIDRIEDLIKRISG